MSVQAKCSIERRVRAAQYVRMSSDQQHYSIKHQVEVIAAYAAERGYEIVCEYADVGRSGVSLAGRHGMRRLLDDVRAGADFARVLVLDVTRWGRFQDIDEGAFHEFMCKRHGVIVEYCAEPFRGDGSAVDDILKAIKRGIAGEYSRDLSIKIFQAQRRLVSLGLKQGGSIPYGLRRLMLADRGHPARLLERGERKHLKSDRVILVPGPTSETGPVRFAFEAYGAHDLPLGAIATVLRFRAQLMGANERWDAARVRSMLANPAYIGDLVYNRTSSKLGALASTNERTHWVVASRVFEPLVSRRLFAKAARRLASHQSGDDDAKDTRLSDLSSSVPPRLFRRIAGLLSIPQGDVSRLLSDLDAQPIGRGSVLAVTRITGDPPGWRCTIWTGQYSASEAFVNAEHGGPAGARAAAAAWGSKLRDWLLEHAKLKRRSSRRRIGASGAAAVVFVPAQGKREGHWLAHWRGPDHRVRRIFSVARYGHDEARRLACEARDKASVADANRLAELDRALRGFAISGEDELPPVAAPAASIVAALPTVTSET